MAFRSGTGPAAQGPEATAAQDEAAHDTTTVEHGAFSHARCGCGWRGPARRSRDRARSDATAHRGTV
ncbi:hypothetical protein DVA86_25005 [Streptomyces armeniacus]|uniref:Uncharacterized protein n=2 Tax=Streptomyces armeniacus TaxID=83291 RepID=A0A345XUV8_9ACTN|nr:hypothetical protein [Streptomyces armeniacus]AXK35424.1 hypothetical protein DVA86_25005 [Streptomyces armeniacus]